jgi:DNA-binding Xre family transcriptional regulator
MEPAPDHTAFPWGRVDCFLGALCRLERYTGPRGSDEKSNIILERSGIPPSTFWRLFTNRNERIGLDALARCCDTLQVDITELLVYRPPHATHFPPLPIPRIIETPLEMPGHITVVLGEVLGGYAMAFGEPLGDLARLIDQPSIRVEATITGSITQIDLPILERVVTLLTAAASKAIAPSHRFDVWLRERGYTPGTTGLVLRYVPPDCTNRS